jgi:dihydrodipicolinate synthase/N-acetylneuraminate lyase
MGREGITFLPAGADSGEGTLLSDEEMFRAWDISVEEAKANNFPVVVANREHPTVAESVRFAKEAEARGFDGIQIYPATLGHIITPTAEMLEAFYEELLPQVNLPVLISSNQSTGFEVPVAVHERLIGRHKNVYAFFKNNPDFLNCATFYARIAPRLPVFTGYLRLPTAFHLGGSGELDNIQNIVAHMPKDA